MSYLALSNRCVEHALSPDYRRGDILPGPAIAVRQLNHPRPAGDIRDYDIVGSRYANRCRPDFLYYGAFHQFLSSASIKIYVFNVAIGAGLQRDSLTHENQPNTD